VKKLIGRVLARVKLKKQALLLYFFVTNSWTGSVNKYRKIVLPLLVRQRSKDGVYAIDLDSEWLGLGARIIKTLEILLYCEENNLNPVIRYNYLEKGKETPDYFSELFYYKLADKDIRERARFTSVRDVDELGWREDYNIKLKLNSAKGLFDKYLGVMPDIIEEVERFIRDHFKSRKVLGIHYRGTDKAGEAPLLAREKWLEQIENVLKENTGLELIFISTDDQKIISFLQQCDLPVAVLFRQDSVRSTDGDQFHRKKHISKSIINRDAIVNMLLLSRCDYLLKTASILSDCSVVFNPTIEVKLISKPHSELLTWWPCTEIIKNQDNK